MKIEIGADDESGKANWIIKFYCNLKTERKILIISNYVLL